MAKVFTELEVATILMDKYGLSVSVRKLHGEVDQNFEVVLTTGERYVFKISNAATERIAIEFQNALIKQLTSHPRLVVQRIIPSSKGEEIIEVNKGHDPLFARLLSWIDGKVFAEVNPHSPLLLHRLGELCGSLCEGLQGFDHAGAHRFMKWDPAQTQWVAKYISTFEGTQKSTADFFLHLFETRVLPVAGQLRKSVNYNDANDYNVLVTGDPLDPQVAGVIDFGDAVHTFTINELAIAISYAGMHKPDPLAAACDVVRGFHSRFPISEIELETLFPLIASRLIISVVCAALNRSENPDNEYLQISDKPAWDLLFKLYKIHPDHAAASFRNACGLEPVKQQAQFLNWGQTHRKMFVSPIEFQSHKWLDLSIDSFEIGNWENIASAKKLNEVIATMVSQAESDVALGKYDEVRSIYQSPEFEVPANDHAQMRTIHLGIDYFCKEGTPVYAMYDGTIHSFANNAGERNYGPTIILEHQYSHGTFYTLNGHLSEDSLSGISIGKNFKAGEQIGTVGQWLTNGNWTPHLHFQIILNMFGCKGDFVGVCAPGDAALWKSNCPDPWLVLTGEPTPKKERISANDIVAFRKMHVGKNLSISYRKPLKMVRGFGQYLIDDQGQRYLDTVNNVAHVGHEHPRVVRAGQRQMALLNTNTRYLHENIVRFVDELLTTFPPELNVAFVVNSGSEANELALRLAKTYTNANDFIVSEIGYHGNTNACIDISSYKFDGPGGKGKGDNVHVIPIPDTYRGLYTQRDSGTLYAAHVRDAIDNLSERKRKPAAFIFESIISCGGQVELPGGFLSLAYNYTRSAGGVCIADEVQTGCGRVGNHFWAFQEHRVVPDIVTIGKPIGNGHPLGVVVTTQAIADAFKNGMEYFNTFGGNPVSCAIGHEVLRVIKEEQLQANALRVGDYLKQKLDSFSREFEVIGNVRGSGLFLGVELVNDRSSREPATDKASYFANRMRDKGILMSTDGPFNNVLKIKPPIIFSFADADFLLEAIHAVCREDFMQ